MQLSTGPPSFALCGGESYDKSQENCCGGLPEAKTGSELYLYRLQIHWMNINQVYSRHQ